MVLGIPMTWVPTARRFSARKAALEGLFRVLLPIRALYMLNLLLGVLLIGIKVKRSLEPGGR